MHQFSKLWHTPNLGIDINSIRVAGRQRQVLKRLAAEAAKETRL
jgi:hypothetical protein